MQGNKYKVCAIGFAHSHMLHNAQMFFDCTDDAVMIAAADTTPRTPTTLTTPHTRRGDLKAAEEKFGMAIYEDWRMLVHEHADMDICLVCSENADHPEVAEALLRRGIHVVLEKPMAADLPGALRIVRAAKAGGSRVFVNWPATWSPGLREAQRLCSAGEIGEIFKLNYRNSESMGALEYGQMASDTQKGDEWWHQSAAGGGAMLDYCCYGACISSWIMGTPRAAYGIKLNFASQYGDAEDNASITVRFDKGYATVEGSWSTVNAGGITGGPVIWGEKGVIVAERDGKVYVYKTSRKKEPDAVVVPQPLPNGRETLGKEVIHCLRTGDATHPTMDLQVNLNAMAILDAGARSAKSGKLEMANDSIWCIG